MVPPVTYLVAIKTDCGWIANDSLDAFQEAKFLVLVEVGIDDSFKFVCPIISKT